MYDHNMNEFASCVACKSFEQVLRVLQFSDYGMKYSFVPAQPTSRGRETQHKFISPQTAVSSGRTCHFQKFFVTRQEIETRKRRSQHGGFTSHHIREGMGMGLSMTRRAASAMMAAMRDDIAMADRRALTLPAHPGPGPV